GSEDVAIAQNQIAGAQQGNEVAFVTVREIGSMNKAESRRGEEFAFFTFARRGFDDFRRIPFAEINLQLLLFEPAFEEINLGGFSGTIETFDGDETAGKTEFGKSFHLLM